MYLVETLFDRLITGLPIIAFVFFTIWLHLNRTIPCFSCGSRRTRKSRRERGVLVCKKCRHRMPDPRRIF